MCTDAQRAHFFAACLPTRCRCLLTGQEPDTLSRESAIWLWTQGKRPYFPGVTGFTANTTPLPPCCHCLLCPQEPDWRSRESAILALGAVSHGCAGGLQPHLAAMVAMLLPALGDGRPMVRIIACWTLGRYSHWMFQGGPLKGRGVGVGLKVSASGRGGDGRLGAGKLWSLVVRVKRWSLVVSNPWEGAVEAGRRPQRKMPRGARQAQCHCTAPSFLPSQAWRSAAPRPGRCWTR